MSNKDHFSDAPNLGDDFSRDARDAADQQRPRDDRPDDGLDEHSLAEWALTPGGSIERDVHTQLSDNARREYHARLNADRSGEDEYLRQVDRQFERAVDEQEADRVRQEVAEERAAEWLLADDQAQQNAEDTPTNDGPPAKRKEMEEQRCYDMPDADDDRSLAHDSEAADEYMDYLSFEAEDERADWMTQEPPVSDAFNIESGSWDSGRSGKDGHGHE